MKYFFFFCDNKSKDEVYFSSKSKKLDVVVYPFKIPIESNKCKATPTDFVETVKNYASYIHTFSVTENFQMKLEKEKGKKEKTYLEQIFS